MDPSIENEYDALRAIKELGVDISRHEDTVRHILAELASSQYQRGELDQACTDCY